MNADRNSILRPRADHSYEKPGNQTHLLKVYSTRSESTTITYMPKKKAATEEVTVEATPVAEPKKSQKIPKLAKKDKHRLPRKEKKAKKKAALKA